MSKRDLNSIESENNEFIAKRSKTNTNVTSSSSSNIHNNLNLDDEIPDIPFDIEMNIDKIRNDVLDLVYKNNPTKRMKARYSKLPGPLPASFSRSSLNTIKVQKYYVCEKSDGERMMFYIPSKINNTTNYCYLIDRKFTLYKIKDITKYANLFGYETLVDGELLYNKDVQQWTLVIFDAICINSKYIAESKLTDRLIAIGQHIAKPYKNRDKNISLALNFRAKTMLPKQYISKLFNMIHQTNKHNEYIYHDIKRQIKNRNDGIIFTPDNDNYLNEKLPKCLLKWKWSGMNTIDFLIKKPYFIKITGNLLTKHEQAKQVPLYLIKLYCAGGQRADLYARDIYIYTEDEKQQLETEFLKINKDKIIVECGLTISNSISSLKDYSHGLWYIERIRADKQVANHVTTAISTMQTIIDNVTKKELIQYCAN